MLVKTGGVTVVPKFKQRETLKVASNYMDDGVIWIVEGETTKPTGMITDLMLLGACCDGWWDESEFV